MTSMPSLFALVLALSAFAGTGITRNAHAQVPAANPLPAVPAAPTEPNLPQPDSSLDAPVDEVSESESAPEPEPLAVPDAAIDTQNYSEQGMSIDFPADWQVETIENGVMISNVTTVETDLVATQVVRMAAPPGAVVDANIDSFLEEGSAVGRYQSVTLDDQDALVIWLSERPDSLSNAIATFIGYDDETILLFSRYSPTNETAVDSILQLHSSFSNIAAVETAEESTDEPVPEVPQLSDGAQ